ncbi:MAG: hypothetical protein IPJ84_05490 [Bdellovibrionales bacterium]|nr:hypothetical protein [Bdellovibrionales bacterium]
MKSTRVLTVALFSVLTVSVTTTATATPSTLPILAKRISSKNPNGKIRSSECLVFPDGVTIDNSIDGLEFSVERGGKVSSGIITESMKRPRQRPRRFSAVLLEHRIRLSHSEPRPPESRSRSFSPRSTDQQGLRFQTQHLQPKFSKRLRTLSATELTLI